MTAVYIVLLSVGTALVCAMLRPQRPEMAMLLSLAAGLAALLLTGDALADMADVIRRFLTLTSIREEGASVILKAAGLTILCELGGQICSDAGESALAGRIRLACRVVMLGMAAPFIAQIMDAVASVG